MKRLLGIAILALSLGVRAGEYYVPEVGITFQSDQIISKGLEIEAVRGENFYCWLSYRNSTKETQLVNFRLSENISHSYELKHLVSWYKDSYVRQSVNHGGGSILVPELLVNDPALIRVDSDIGNNKIRFQHDGKIQYISSQELELFPNGSDGRIRMNASEYSINDANKLQSISLLEGQVETLLITLPISTEASVGDNYLTLEVKTDSGIVSLPVTISVKPYVLAAPAIEYSVFYRGLVDTKGNTVSSERKTPVQLGYEFKHIASARHVNPVIYQPAIELDFDKYMAIRSEHFIDGEKLYFVDSIVTTMVKEGQRSNLRNRFEKIRNAIGENQNAIFLINDEPRKEDVENVLAMHDIFKEYNFEFFVTGREENLSDDIVPNATYVLAYEPSKSIAEKIHFKGGRVFSYANPQVGVIDLEGIRYNYGLSLLKNDYDGAMLYAYQDSRGSVWSDFDGRYRDHMFSYPTSDGLLNTVSWIAFNESITDVAYHQTLVSMTDELKKMDCGDSNLLNLLEETIEKVESVSRGSEQVYRNSMRNALDAAYPILKACLPRKIQGTPTSPPSTPVGFEVLDKR